MGKRETGNNTHEIYGGKWAFPLEISWVEAKIAKNVHNLSKQLTEFYHFYSDITHCRNFMIFLSLRFYVKSILENLEVLMPFLPSEFC